MGPSSLLECSWCFKRKPQVMEIDCVFSCLISVAPLKPGSPPIVMTLIKVTNDQFQESSGFILCPLQTSQPPTFISKSPAPQMPLLFCLPQNYTIDFVVTFL